MPDFIYVRGHRKGCPISVRVQRGVSDSIGVQKWVPDSTGGTEMDAQFYISRGQKGVPDFGKGTERGVR